jgi:tRNA threonylcarbamoyladenosine biosynthesis protein TsaB
MFTLAIETSAVAASVALLEGDRCLAERNLQLGARHGQSLIAELGKLLELQELGPSDCGLMAVSIGPGSLTGLLVGVVCAKIWSYTTKCALVAVDTHRAIAASSPADVETVHVISPSQGGDLFFSRHRRSDGDLWTEIESLAYLPLAEWLTQLKGDEIVSGPALAKLELELAGKCRLLPTECWTPQARQVGRLGIALCEAGQTSDAWLLEPRYLRLSSAEEKWDLRRRV